MAISVVRHHLLASSAGKTDFISEQGFAIGRPSFLQVTIEHNNAEISAVSVGGQSYYMGAGHLELPDA